MVLLKLLVIKQKKAVQITDIQYFKVENNKILNAMHDLKAMYDKTLEFVTEIFEDDVDSDGNFRFFPRKSKMSDLDIIALAICSESAGIDSERWLFSKLKTDYKSAFPSLIDRTRFNRRRRMLSDQISEMTKRSGMTMGVDSDIHIVDSVPCPIVKNSRERGFTICKEDPVTAPRKGFSAVDQRYYIGYKLHLLSNEFGVIQDFSITPANVHDLDFLKFLEPENHCQGKTIVGDKGYISARVQTSLFDEYDITLKVPYRSNQINKVPLDPELGRKRRRIETQFSQLCDQFRLKHNYAKTFKGFLTRLMSKLAAIAVLQMVNLEKGRPINHLKHAWV